MYRKIMDYLKEWKHSEHRKSLIPWDIRFVLRAFVFPQRRMRRSKHIELEYDINFWQDNKIVFVGK